MRKHKHDVDLCSVVFSLKGRDVGVCYAVVGYNDETTVWISDGFKHKLAQPKLKNIRHLKFEGAVLTAIAEKLVENKKVFDSELRSALRAYQTTSNEQEKE